VTHDIPGEFEQHNTGEYVVLLVVLAVLISLTALAYYTTNVDFPFRISTYSRALYVDEGSYSDAAQNFLKFGSW